MSGFVGIYVIIKIIKHIFGVIINDLAIYKMFGCGFALLGSLWNTTAVWLVNHYRYQDGHSNHKKMRRAEEGLPDKDTEPIEMGMLTSHNNMPQEQATKPHVTESWQKPIYPSVSHWTLQDEPI